MKLALPMIGGQLGQVLVNFVDMVMVGKLGTYPLAGVSLANAIFVVLIVVGMGISHALSPLVSFADGAKGHQEIPSFFKHSLTVNMIFAFTALGLIELIIPMLHHLGQERAVLAEAIPYLRISSWTIIPMMFFLTLRGLSEGLSFTMPPMVAIIIGNMVNVIGNYTFIYGKFGIEAMGAPGAALSSFIARVVMCVVLLLILRKNYGRVYSYINAMIAEVFDRRMFKKILALGLPTSLQGFFEVSAFSGAAIIMGMVSGTAQAAHQVAISLASMTFLFCSGLAGATTIRVGNQYGQRNVHKLQLVGLASLWQVALFMLFTGILFITFRQYLPMMYIHDEPVVAVAAQLLVLAAIFQIPDGLQVVALGALRGLQDVKVPTLITLLAYWMLGIPISYLCAIYWDFGPKGVWVGLISGLTVAAVLLVLRFNKKSGLAIDR